MDLLQTSRHTGTLSEGKHRPTCCPEKILGATVSCKRWAGPRKRIGSLKQRWLVELAAASSRQGGVGEINESVKKESDPREDKSGLLELRDKSGAKYPWTCALCMQ